MNEELRTHDVNRLIGEAIGEGMNKLIRQAYIDGEKSMRERAAELCLGRGLEGTACGILALPIEGEQPVTNRPSNGGGE